MHEWILDQYSNVLNPFTVGLSREGFEMNVKSIYIQKKHKDYCCYDSGETLTLVWTGNLILRMCRSMLKLGHEFIFSFHDRLEYCFSFHHASSIECTFLYNCVPLQLHVMTRTLSVISESFHLHMGHISKTSLWWSKRIPNYGRFGSYILGLTSQALMLH